MTLHQYLYFQVGAATFQMEWEDRDDINEWIAARPSADIKKKLRTPEEFLEDLEAERQWWLEEENPSELYDEEDSFCWRFHFLNQTVLTDFLLWLANNKEDADEVLQIAPNLAGKNVEVFYRVWQD